MKHPMPRPREEMERDVNAVCARTCRELADLLERDDTTGKAVDVTWNFLKVQMGHRETIRTTQRIGPRRV